MEVNTIADWKFLEHKKRVYDHSTQVQSSQTGLLINESDSLFEVIEFQVWVIFTAWLLFSETRSYLVHVIQVLHWLSGRHSESQIQSAEF